MHGRTSREALRGLLCIGVPLSGRDLAWDMKTSLEGIAWHGLREACMSWHGKGGRKLHGQLERVHVKLAFAWHEWDVKLSQMKFTWAMQFEDQVLRQNEKHMGLVEDMWRLEWRTMVGSCEWSLAWHGVVHVKIWHGHGNKVLGMQAMCHAIVKPTLEMKLSECKVERQIGGQPKGYVHGRPKTMHVK
ncbi:hypothetical protein GH714_043983 [Hevea brasiliensis]|uniref:Uncharacterized protein n=1 Tax=Hevea brasiliensis TaxID=3981 RepID=A0A6A6K2X2_HEVBR|nr:hypothetical protein GH714_043983 [Hevea brasiliensis]